MWGKGTAFESPCPGQHCRDPVRDSIHLVFSSFLAHGFTAEFDPEGIVDQPVENAVGDGWIADLFVPVRDWHLRSNNDGSALVAIVTDFQKVAASLSFKRRHGKVVEHQHVDAG